MQKVKIPNDSKIIEALENWRKGLDLENVLLGTHATEHDFEHVLDKKTVLNKLSEQYLNEHILSVEEECDCHKAEHWHGETNLIDLGFNSDYHDELNKVFENTQIGNLKYLRPSGRFWYPSTGYMGWHNNNDNEGYRLYANWAEEGHKSFFRYRDPVTKEIVTSWDKKGWNFRLFECSEETTTWHCVYSDTNRISVGYWYEAIPTKV